MTGAKHYRWDELPREELSPTIGRRLITGNDLMIAHVYLAKGAVVPKHAHHNEQLTYILEGVLRFRLGDDESHVVDVARRRGADNSAERPAHCRGARGHARRRCLHTAARGLARRQRRLPAASSYLTQS